MASMGSPADAESHDRPRDFTDASVVMAASLSETGTAYDLFQAARRGLVDLVASTGRFPESQPHPEDDVGHELSRAADRSVKPREQLPQFASREEEAEFWDTHDLTDYWPDFKPVQARFARSLSEGITIRLDPETLAELRKRAHARGIDPTTLVRMWIIEQLQATKPLPN